MIRITVVLVLLAFPAPASAALPAEGRDFEAHDHRLQGRNWHVQMEIADGSARRVQTLVAYSEACGATVARRDVPIAEDGAVAVQAPVKGGTFRFYAKFTGADAVEGAFRIVKNGCDTGILTFRVGPATDGHDHSHAQHEGPKYPDLDGASVAETRQAIALRHRVVAAAAERFYSYRVARRMGYERLHIKRKRPLIFHLRKPAYDHDDHIFDARRPESLVYWWPAKGQPVLLGMMFRVPPGRRPAFAGPIPIYHQHGPTNQMTHVWLTGYLRPSWSDCLPVADLEAANPEFEYTRPSGIPSPNETPC